MKNNTINSKQLILFIISSQIGFGILGLPSYLAKYVGHDGWIVVIIVGAIASIAIIIIVSLLRRYEDKSILEINKILYGKYIGYCLNLLFIIYLSLGAAVGLRTFTDVINVTILRLTPPIVLACFIIIPSVYLSIYGLQYICKFINILAFVFIIIIIYCILIYKDLRLTFLMPIGDINLSSMLKASNSVFFTYLGIELIAFIYPNIKEKEHVLKYALYANLFSTFMFSLTVIITTMLFGENMLKHISAPIFGLARVYKAPILERTDLFFIAMAVPVMASSMQIYYFCGYYTLVKNFNIKNKKMFLFMFTAVEIFLSRIPKDMVQNNKYSALFAKFGVGIILFLILSYLFSFIRKKEVCEK